MPPARELLSLALPIVAVKPEPGEHLPDLRFERVAVARNEFVLEFLITVGNIGVLDACMIELRHAASQGFHFFLHGVEVVKD